MGKEEIMKLLMENAISMTCSLLSDRVDMPILVYSLLENKKTRKASIESLVEDKVDFAELHDKLMYVLGENARDNLKKVRGKTGMIVNIPRTIEELVDRALFVCDSLDDTVKAIIHWSLEYDEIQEIIDMELPPSLENSEDADNVDNVEDMEDETEYSVMVDLVTLAKLNKLDNVIGRDKEIQSITEVLGRKNSKSLLITGNTGVGKTSIIEGLAQRIASGQVPKYLFNKKIYKIDISKLVASLKSANELAKVLDAILNKVQEEDAIAFFDDLSMLIRLESMLPVKILDIIKPYIADGSISFIGILNTNNLKLIKGDLSFLRLVQEINIGETSIEETTSILKSRVKEYRKHHKIRIDEGILDELVKLTDRHVRNRNFPDKAFFVLDSACAKAISSEYNALTLKHIKETISSMIGVDINRLDKSQKAQLVTLDKRIKSKLIGQDLAVDKVVKAIKRNKVGFSDTNRPIGTFMFIGKTGVGKTELCKVLAKEMFGSDKAIIKLDMSEYSEKHNVARLIGAPPGYVGYDDTSVLAESIRNKPYSVVLFDEIEKAHPDVFNILLQILEDGVLTTGKGEKLYFNNAIIVMTSNIGQEKNNKRSIGFSTQGVVENDIQDDRDYLKPYFKPEIINRIDTVIRFNSLSKEDIYSIVKLELDKSIGKLQDIKVNYGSSIIKYIAEKGYDETYGARTIRRIVEDEIEGYISDLVLDSRARKGDTVLLSYRANAIRHRVKRQLEDEESIVRIDTSEELSTQTNNA